MKTKILENEDWPLSDHLFLRHTTPPFGLKKNQQIADESHNIWQILAFCGFAPMMCRGDEFYLI
ncbi:MAG: hypothetical protein CL932_03475 [Deltaproteobacteria bacterium]|nr:hypothetical protein [Deltaproteobacteria bacterium]